MYLIFRSNYLMRNLGLSAILVFVGVKMVIVGFYKIPIIYSLFTILGILIVSIVISLIFPKKEKAELK